MVLVIVVVLGLLRFGDSAKGKCDDSMWNNVTDSDGNGCDYYISFPSVCGRKDNSDFIANKMCCACRGGLESRIFRIFSVRRTRHVSLLKRGALTMTSSRDIIM